MPRRSEDAGLWVKFYQREMLNKAKSYGEKILDNDGKLVGEVVGEGRPIFDTLDYVEIVVAGDKSSVIDRPATCCDAELFKASAVQHGNCRAVRPQDCDVHRFHDEFIRYKQGQAEQTQGTPLKTWPGIDRGTVEELAYFKVYTVEQLGALADSNAAKFLSIRERARDYLKAAEKVSHVAGVRAENDALRSQLASIQAQLDQLVAAKATDKPVAKGKAA